MRFRTFRAISFGIVALLIAILPGAVWTALLIVNLRTNPAIPWSVALMGLFLWLLWRTWTAAALRLARQKRAIDCYERGEFHRRHSRGP